MDIVESTQGYESWLGQLIPLIPADLEAKHEAMGQSAFPFLRATFYRWVQLWPRVCPELLDAPTVLAIGDLHIENFGTWRDEEGRLVWGINDFDEAYPLPFTVDLLRLATSALVATQENVLAIHPREACGAILEGYQKGLESQYGRPFVLSEEHQHLRDMALTTLRDPIHFWQKMDQYPVLAEIPPAALAVLQSAMPEPGLALTVVHRPAGLGSLGRQRYTAVAAWRGGRIARENKQLLVSAATWEKSGAAPDKKIYYQQIIDHAAHTPDPFTHLVGDWVVRRLAPDCSRIELADLPRLQDEARLLSAMGWETANIHIGSGLESCYQILSNLLQRPEGWLFKASQAMTEATIEDWKTWKKHIEK